MDNYSKLYRQFRTDYDLKAFAQGLVDIGFRMLVHQDISEERAQYAVLIKDDETVEIKIFDGQVRVRHTQTIPKRWLPYLTKIKRLRINYKNARLHFLEAVQDRVNAEMRSYESYNFEFFEEKFWEEEWEMFDRNIMDYLYIIERDYSESELDDHISPKECAEYLMTPEVEFFDVLYGTYTTNPFYNLTEYETIEEYRWAMSQI